MSTQQASQKVNTAAAATLLKWTVYRPSRSLLCAPQKEQFRIQLNKMQQWLKLQVQTDLENNVSQRDGPLAYKHNAVRLYLGKDFSEQQTGNGWPTCHWSQHSLTNQTGHGLNLTLHRPTMVLVSNMSKVLNKKNYTIKHKLTSKCLLIKLCNY